MNFLQLSVYEILIDSFSLFCSFSEKNQESKSNPKKLIKKAYTKYYYDDIQGENVVIKNTKKEEGKTANTLIIFQKLFQLLPNSWV